MAEIQEIQLRRRHPLHPLRRNQNPIARPQRPTIAARRRHHPRNLQRPHPNAAKLSNIHRAICLYAQYAIGAFKNLGGAEVEELNLKFGLKIGGKGGIPILAEASSEGNFEIEVKCKFPKDKALSGAEKF